MKVLVAPGPACQMFDDLICGSSPVHSLAGCSWATLLWWGQRKRRALGIERADGFSEVPLVDRAAPEKRGDTGCVSARLQSFCRSC